MVQFATFIKGEGSEFASAFWIITLIINGIAFPLGVVLVTAYAWPVVRMVWRTARGRPCAAEELDAARLRVLRMGHVIALIGVAEWLLSGIVFPLGIHLLAGHFPTHGPSRLLW